MENKKIKYMHVAVKEPELSYEEKCRETKEYWERYFKENKDEYQKKRKDGESFAKWCVDKSETNLLVDWKTLNDIDPLQVGSHSHNKVKTMCPNGHPYDTIISALSDGSRCPYCSVTRKKVLVGYNDLATTNPELVEMWDYTRNSKPPSAFMSGQEIKVWWKCSNGHHFQRKIDKMVRAKHKCPLCPKGFNLDELSPSNVSEADGKCQSDKFTKTQEYWEQYFQLNEDHYPRQRKSNPSFAKWCLLTGNVSLLIDWDKNNSIKPQEISFSARKQVNILCEKGHVYPSILNYLANGNRCPYCAGSSVLPGYNDLKTKNPELVKEWDCKKNKLKPSDVTAMSNQTVWWLCKNGHSYQASISKRVIGRGCPVCNGKEVVSGFNDLESLFPEIMSEWDYKKNQKPPSEYTSKSHAKVFWICSSGHSWYAQIKSRTLGGNQCPYCFHSRGEEAIQNVLDRFSIKYIKQNKFEDRVMPDTGWPLKDDFALIKNEKILCTIEYNGLQHAEPIDFAGNGAEWAEKAFERTKLRDQIKTEYLKEHDITQYIIWYYDFDNIEQIVYDILQENHFI